MIRFSYTILALSLASVVTAATPPDKPVQPAGSAQPGKPAQTAGPAKAGRDPKLVKVGYIGLTARPLPADAPPRVGGVLIEAVAADGPADRAGVKKGDIVVRINDQIIFNPAQLAALVHTRRAGESVGVAVVRRGTETTLNAKIEEREQPAEDLSACCCGCADDEGEDDEFEEIEFEVGGRKYLVQVSEEGLKLAVTLYDGPLDRRQVRRSVPDEAFEALRKISGHSTLMRNLFAPDRAVPPVPPAAPRERRRK